MKIKNILRKAVSVFVATFIASVMIASPSFAGLGIGDSGGTGGGSGSGNNGGGGGTTAPPTTGGGGTPSNLRIDRRVPDAANNCPVRDDGRAALGADYIFKTEYTISYSGPEEFQGINGWIYDYAANNGTYFFHRETFLQRNCLYPSRTTTVVYQCVIRSDAQIWMVVPTSKSLGTATGYSGWNAGSNDIAGCQNSHSRVNIYTPIVEDGYYEARAVTTSQNITVEVPITANDVTGAFDAPKVVGHSGIYAGVPRFSSASLDCANGPKSPGILLIDYSGTRCSSENSTTPLYQCTAEPVKVEFQGETGTAVGNQFQAMKDNRWQRLEFNQSVSGAGITVNKLSTRYERSALSTPWDTSLSANDNLFHLYKNKDDKKSMFDGNDGTKTQWGAAPWNTIWTSSNQASDGPVINPDGSKSTKPEDVEREGTTITQRIRWEGTRTTTVFAVTSVDPMSGTLGFTPFTTQVPTAGDCTDSAKINYQRAMSSLGGY